MRVGIVGTGRMGKILAARMAAEHEVILYDTDVSSARKEAETLNLKAVPLLNDLKVDAVVLAIPDNAIGGCIAELSKIRRKWNIFSVATNISREMLAEFSGEKLHCLNVKIIGHAGEMGRGAKPVIVIDGSNAEMVRLAQQIFSTVGTTVVGEADQVKQINSVATAEALKAAVAIEQTLETAGIKNLDMIQGALLQVATGVIRAYAEDDLGSFAKQIVKTLRGKTAQ